MIELVIYYQSVLHFIWYMLIFFPRTQMIPCLRSNPIICCSPTRKTFDALETNIIILFLLVPVDWRSKKVCIPCLHANNYFLGSVWKSSKRNQAINGLDCFTLLVHLFYIQVLAKSKNLQHCSFGNSCKTKSTNLSKEQI